MSTLHLKEGTINGVGIMFTLIAINQYLYEERKTFTNPTVGKVEGIVYKPHTPLEGSLGTPADPNPTFGLFWYFALLVESKSEKWSILWTDV